MASKTDFEIDDLVWAKMKQYPFWPAQIAKPPTANEKAVHTAEELPKKKPSVSRKDQHYVFFFGTRNFAWISKDNIVPHTEDMFKKVPKKPSASFSKAIQELIEISTPFPTSVKEDSVQEELTNRFSAVQSQSTTTYLKKRGRKRKRKNSCIETKKSQKKILAEEASDIESFRVQKISDTELSEAQKNITGIPCVGSIEEFVHRCDSPPCFHQPTIAVCEYSELSPVPSVDLSRTDTPVMKKCITPSSEKIGVIGLGMMGQRIIKNLLDSKHNVSIWNRTAEKCKQFVDIGAKQFLTPAELVLNCDIILCCLSGPKAVQFVMSQVDGILQGFENSESRGKAYVEMTCMDMDTSRVISECITERGGRYLEAPIIGSLSLAEKGSLVIFAAGDLENIVRCRSCFAAISEHLCYLSSDVGEASKYTFVLNALAGSACLVLAEAMSVGELLNISNISFLNYLKLSKMNCPLYEVKGQAMTTNNFSTDISFKHQQQSLNMALELGSTYKYPLHLASIAHQVYKECERYSEYDISAVVMKLKNAL
ncbi:putative oxidoreductase GLYR1 [Trichonephila clavipes]|nr:putative oxidoreductase GLYR1 [Trichonephila clavipes]